MKVKNFDEAINITVQKYNYNDEQIKKIYEELEKGNFSVITSDYGAREVVRKHYDFIKKNHDKTSPFTSFTELTNHFNRVLNVNNIKKDDPEAIKYLYYNILNHMQYENLQKDVEKIIFEAAIQYSNENQNSEENIRKYSFDTPDITRKEATELTKIYMGMENQKQKINEAFYKYQAYQRELIVNIIKYSYYEHDFSISLEEQINACKSSKR